jgi:hypothetical protein
MLGKTFRVLSSDSQLILLHGEENVKTTIQIFNYKAKCLGTFGSQKKNEQFGSDFKEKPIIEVQRRLDRRKIYFILF